MLLEIKNMLRNSRYRRREITKDHLVANLRAVAVKDVTVTQNASLTMCEPHFLEITGP